MKRRLRLLLVLMAVSSILAMSHCSEVRTDRIRHGRRTYPLHPEMLAEAPEIPSPLTTGDGREIIVSFSRDDRYSLVPVTVENGESLDYRNGQWYGKGRQLDVDSFDFPVLAGTGLHSETELDQTETITGVPVAEITRIGRPEAYSTAGFMSRDEEIVSVLRGDNGLVRRLGLTHPQCARPLFHVFNLIQSGRRDSERANVGGILYNGRKVHLEFRGSKGWQESVFDDEILGYWEIDIRRELDQEEQAFLSSRYPHLTEGEMAELREKLAHIHTGEMVPFYIMRYGFYEGHTSYRADPIAIASLFGLRSIPEIESAFEGKLYEVLRDHFSGESVGE